MDIKIHDSQIQKYIVDFERKEITLKIRTEDNESVNIEFIDVIAYFFENTITGCIIFDIEKIDVEDFISQIGESYIMEHKNYGWPLSFIDISDLKKKIDETGINIYSLSSSYGMSGYILANQINIINS